ncbi:MAG: hypothetical protein ACRDRN_07400 [Sciscionella sp.]
MRNRAVPVSATPTGDRSPWMMAALLLAALAALLGVAGPLLPVVQPSHGAGFAAGPMLVVLAVLPVALAALAVARGRSALGCGVLAAVALFAPGRLLTDLQLAVDVSHSARPELVLPDSLDPLHAGPGLWLLIAAHLLAIGAGLAAVAAARQLTDGTASLDMADAGDAGSAATRQGRVAGALCVGMIAAVALLVVAPFRSDNLYLLGRTLLEQPALPLAGGLLLVVAAVVAPTMGAAFAERERAAGGVAGAAIGLLTIALPPLVAGFAVRGLHPTWGSWIAVAAAVVLGVMATAIGLAVRVSDRAAHHEPSEVALPGQIGLHRAAGALAVAAGVCALVAAMSRQIVVPAQLPQVHEVGQRLLIPAGAILLVLGVALLVPAAAATIRPALSVAWVTVPMAAAGGLDGVFTAIQIDGIRAGAGAWLSGVAALAAVAAACCAGLAGGVERDDVDVSERACRLPVLLLALSGTALAVAGFGLPMLRATGYSAAGLWSHFRFASWGLVLALVAVALAAVIAGFARPARGAGLLVGAAAVLGMHCLKVPLTPTRALPASAGPGLLPCLLGVVAMLTAAAVAGLLRHRVRVGAEL